MSWSSECAEQVARLRHERQPAAALPLRCLQPGAVRGQRERVGQPLQQHALVLAEPVATVRRHRQRADHPPLGDTGTITIERGGVPRSGATWRARAVGDHDRQVGAARVRRTRLPAAIRVPRTASGRPLTAPPRTRRRRRGDQQVRRVGVQRVTDPLRGERKVVVDGEPEQRVVTQPERVGLPAYAGASARTTGCSSSIRCCLRDQQQRGGAVGRPTALARRRPAPASRPRPAASTRPARRPSAERLARAVAGRRRGSTIWWKGRPTTCSGCHPNSRVASAFQAATVPSASSSTTATAAPSTVHRSAAAAPACRRCAVDPSRSQTSQTRLDDEVYSTPHDEAIDEVMSRPRPPSASSSGARSPVRQRAAGMLVLHLDPEALRVEPQVDRRGRTGMDHCVGDQLAHRQRRAVRELGRTPFLQLQTGKSARLRDRTRIRVEAASRTLRQR